MDLKDAGKSTTLNKGMLERFQQVGPLMLEWWIHWEGVLFGGARLLTHQFQAEKCCGSCRVAAIIQHIDLGGASNPV